ncbi:helix-turn-helix domain-containing protein [Salmonella enterica subsp. enterica]|uniref:transcriptional regulator n=1 Tax=Salmonella enterica TaxID=28901 RepID=UPI0012BE359C|nr:YdaS family helix-turn-helix protein [Salmonella enterica]EBS2232029.1 Cro/Cl family transcriptional regulator [Salmonella enterica subsp. enterica serovar Middlesbrough]EBX2183593.1 Cro/Cl family transcriptional regulator [Salmonella enterica subsp. enterica serovar Aba]ECB3807397.1 helix-turn-helix domain-containing protein [Salmonella enterica subsp. enterica serovar Fufu]ECF1703313.1 helix-turn-helix domain-containing protein [Salmonella enterica subsp. enterica]ECG5317597.1 helix-turn-
MEKTLQEKILSKMSQSELGRRLGKKPQTISLWFRGRVPGEEVLRTAEALGWHITPHELRPDLYPNPNDGLPETKAA